MAQLWLPKSGLCHMFFILATLFTPLNAYDSRSDLGIILPCTFVGGTVFLSFCIWICCCYQSNEQQGKMNATNQGVNTYTVSRCQVVNGPWTNGGPVITTTDLMGGQIFVHPYTNVSYIPPTGSVDGSAQPQPFPTSGPASSGPHNAPTLGPAHGARDVPTSWQSNVSHPTVSHPPDTGYLSPNPPQNASQVFPNRWSKQGQRNYNGFPSDFGRYQHNFVATRAGPAPHLPPNSSGDSTYVCMSSDSFPPSYDQLGFGTAWAAPPEEGIAVIGGSSGFSSSDAFGGGGGAGDFNTSSTIDAGCDSGFSGGACDSSGGGCDSGCGGGISSCD